MRLTLIGTIVGRWLGWWRLLKRCEDRLQCVVVDVGHLRQLTHQTGEIWHGCRRRLDLGLRITIIRSWRSVRLRRIARLWWVGWLLCS